MNLHNQIMNIQYRSYAHDDDPLVASAYALGHYDARHAAAELALKHDAAIEEALPVLERLVDVLNDVGFDGWCTNSVHGEDADALVKLLRTLKSL